MCIQLACTGNEVFFSFLNWHFLNMYFYTFCWNSTFSTVLSETQYSHTHSKTYVCGPSSLSLSVGSLSVLTGCSPGPTTVRQTQGGEETPGSAKCHGWTVLQGPAVWENPVWHPWKQIKYTVETIWEAILWFLHFSNFCLPKYSLTNCRVLWG